jgi:hypothetical protein
MTLSDSKSIGSAAPFSLILDSPRFLEACDMKPRAKRKKSMKSNRNKKSVYGIRKHIAFWAVDFEGQTAVFDHEQGAYYVAYLLLNPPSEPMHAMALALKAHVDYEHYTGVSFIIDPFTSKVVPVDREAVIQERNLALDDAEALAGLRRKQLQLEAILEQENESEPVKAEVLAELEGIYDFQKRNPLRATDAAQSVVRAVRRAIIRFHEHLTDSLDPQGRPHPVLRGFAAHLEKCLLIPSARYSKAGHARNRAGAAGYFTYEPTPGIAWEK